MNDAAGGKLAYEYRLMSPEDDDVRAVADLFRVVWPEGRHMTFDYLVWLYRDNPCGPVIGVNAWHGIVLAAHYAVIPIRAFYHGREVKGALSLNTATHPDHRGQGLFTKLAEATYAQAARDGVHHVIGVANANSTPGFLKKLSFTLVAPLDARLVWRTPEVCATGQANSVSWRRHWTAEDFAWRVRNPSRPYWIQRRRGCRYVLAPTHVPTIRAILKIDSNADEPRTPATGLPRSLMPGVRLWMGLTARMRFPSGGGLPVPERFRGSPLNLIFRPLQNDSDAIDRETVEFEAIDFDAY